MEENTDEQLSNSSLAEAPAVETAEQEVQTEETQPETTESSIAEVASHAAETVETPAKSRSERRQENYIDKLSEQIRNSSVSAFTQREEQQTQSQYQPLKYAEGDYDLDALERDRQAYGQAEAQRAKAEASQDFARQLGPVLQREWARDLELDNERVAKVWNVLDETDEEHFDEDVAKEMTQKYLNFIGYREDKNGAVSLDRPNVRWIDFIRAEKQTIDRFVNQSVETSTKNVIKQAANTGVRPGAQARAPKGSDVDLTDPNWISKLSREEWDEWGRAKADEVINKRLNIK